MTQFCVICRITGHHDTDAAFHPEKGCIVCKVCVGTVNYAYTLHGVIFLPTVNVLLRLLLTLLMHPVSIAQAHGISRFHDARECPLRRKAWCTIHASRKGSCPFGQQCEFAHSAKQIWCSFCKALGHTLGECAQSGLQCKTCGGRGHVEWACDKIAGCPVRSIHICTW